MLTFSANIELSDFCNLPVFVEVLEFRKKCGGIVKACLLLPALLNKILLL